MIPTLTGRTDNPDRLIRGLVELGWTVREEGDRLIAISPAGQQVEANRETGELRITGRGEGTAARALVKLAVKLGAEVELEGLTFEDRRPLVYGPVPSRRLGTSLGIDLPRGVCTHDCEYCSVGVSRRVSPHKRFTVDPITVREELSETLRRCDPDAVTFAGVGEPTLCANLREIAEEIRPLVEGVGAEMVLLTNSTWVSECADVVDVAVASLDCAREDLYRTINRPHPNMSLEDLVEELGRCDPGDVVVEVLLCRVGRVTNADPDHLKELAGLLGSIGLERVQLNTVARPPARGRAEPVSREELLSARRTLELCGLDVSVYE
ncbi:radical SAM protein [Methanopyrus sp. KOL6]|uniref:radical SAM protein n=1 Tax=Methanopyrus sp. KOL6 TaxID=1937004 RepID=UPI000B4B0F99|nr:radical SAM protein [Methanopyrus sp. KOL6]